MNRAKENEKGRELSHVWLKETSLNLKITHLIIGFWISLDLNNQFDLYTQHRTTYYSTMSTSVQYTISSNFSSPYDFRICFCLIWTHIITLYEPWLVVKLQFKYEFVIDSLNVLIFKSLKWSFVRYIQSDISTSTHFIKLTLHLHMHRYVSIFAMFRLIPLKCYTNTKFTPINSSLCTQREREWVRQEDKRFQSDSIQSGGILFSCFNSLF